MVDLILLIRFLKIGIVVLGSLIAYYGFRGFLRNKSKSLLLLSIGFIFITLGSFTAGVLFEFFGYSLIMVNIIEPIVQLIGFLLIVYSLVGKIY
ncbi:MAG: hypothetical protein QXX95_02850 [Nitrososphaerales archaeon]